MRWAPRPWSLSVRSSEPPVSGRVGYRPEGSGVGGVLGRRAVGRLGRLVQLLGRIVELGQRVAVLALRLLVDDVGGLVDRSGDLVALLVRQALRRLRKLAQVHH